MTEEQFNDIKQLLSLLASNRDNNNGNTSTNNMDRNNAIFNDLFSKRIIDINTSFEYLKNKIDKFSKTTEEANKKLTELQELKNSDEYNNLSNDDKILFDEEIKLRELQINEIKKQTEYEKSIRSVNNKLKEEELKHQADINKAQNDYLKSQTEYIGKIKQQNARHIEARTIQEKWEARGLNRNGKKNSGAELFDAIGKFGAKLKTESVGRLIGEGLAKSVGGIKNGLNFIDSGKMDVGAIAGKVSGALSNLGPYGAAAGATVDILAKLFEMYAKVNAEASKYARTVGGGKSAMYDIQTQMGKYADNLSIAGKRAYDAADFIKALGEYSTEAGRNFEYIGEKGVESLYNLQQFGVNSKVISQFDTFGISITDVDERIASLYNNSSKKGINAKAVQEKMINNLKMAQNYTFANGVKALERMAQRSTELKINMENAVRFADKVSTLEGALTSGAQLSVLGGSIARFSNPLSMLYDSLNDVEGMMNRTLKMTEGMASFDYEKGQIDISAFNRMRLKAMSEATGIDYGELTTQTMNQARENVVLSQIKGGLGEDTQNYIKNIAQIDSAGTAYVMFGKERRDVNKLTNAEKKLLKQESEKKDNSENKRVGDIFNETRGIQERLDDLVRAVKTTIVNLLMKLAGVEGNVKYKYGLSDEEYADYLKVDNLSRDARSNYYGWSESDKINYIISDEAKFHRKKGEEYIDKTLKSNKEAYNTETDIGGDIAHYFATNNLGSGMHGIQLPTAADLYYDSHQKPISKSNGGYISGIGTSTSDSIPAMLSNGEFVVNARATNNNRELLEKINGYKNGGFVKASDNQYGSVKFSRNDGYAVNSSNQNSSIKIDLSGTLKLDAGTITKDIPADKLLTPEFVDQIIKNIQSRMDFGLNRDNLRQKYG